MGVPQWGGGGGGGRFGVFPLLFLFLFCDDVGTLQGHVSQSWKQKRGEGMAGGKFHSVPDVIRREQGKGGCRSTGGKGDAALRGFALLEAPSQSWASS